MKITSETMIPLSFIVVLAGAILWLGTMYSDISHANLEISNLRSDIVKINESRAEYRKRLWESQRSIDRRLSQIEGKIDLLINVDKK